MGLFSKITRSITKPLKKVIKSPFGKAALLGLGAYYGGQAGMFGKGIQNQGWKKFIGGKLPAWAYTPGTEGIWSGVGSASGPGLGGVYTAAKPAGGIIGAAVNFAKDHPYVTAGALTAGTAAAAGVPDEEDVPFPVIASGKPGTDGSPGAYNHGALVPINFLQP